AAAHAHGQLGGADASTRPVGEEALHTAVFKRVEGDPSQPASWAEDAPGQWQRFVELIELVVDRDAKGLERPLGGMAGGESGRSRNRRLDHVDQLERALQRLVPALGDDGARDRSREALLAEVPQDTREAPLVPSVDDLGGRQLL